MELTSAGVTAMFWLDGKVDRRDQRDVWGRTDRCKVGGQPRRE